MQQINQVKDLLEQYLNHCVYIRNYAEATIKSYREVFKLLQKETGILPLNQLNRHLLESWFLNGRIKRNWTPTTFRHYHKRLNTFFKWLEKEKIIQENPLLNMELPKMESKLPRTLSRDNASILLDASFHIPYKYRFERFRNRAMVGLMLLAGLRRSEVVKLKINDVSFETKTIFLNQAKGHKDRLVPMNAKLFSMLDEYVKDRKRLNKQCLGFITAVQRDKPITGRAISNLTAHLRAYTKISFSAHTLRHAFATLMLEGGCDIYSLSKIMGHNRITTTTIYLSCTHSQMLSSVEKHQLNTISF